MCLLFHSRWCKKGRGNVEAWKLVNKPKLKENVTKNFLVISIEVFLGFVDEAYCI